MSQSLIAFDTDHIKGYVFGTSKLKEIRGASSLLDYLNRVETDEEAKRFNRRKIFAHGGSALFLIDSENSEEEAELLGQIVQGRYRNETGGGASITYAVQPIPANTVKDIMTAEQVTEDVSMVQILQLLRLRLRLAKDSQQTSEFYHIAQPTHAFLCMCESCGVAYAEDILPDPGEQENRYCRVCKKKRDKEQCDEDEIKDELPRIIRTAQSASGLSEDNGKQKLWERILWTLSEQKYDLSGKVKRIPDFQAFRLLARGKEYLGLIYADANNMGKAIEKEKTLEKVMQFAVRIDQAVFTAVAEAIKKHLPVHSSGMLPFDLPLIGGDDIVMITSADKSLHVAHAIAENFHKHSAGCTLSVGVVLAPVTYPFNLQLKLAEEILKDIKKASAISQINGDGLSEESRISFVVITGSTSLSYEKIYNELHYPNGREEFQATLRPYTLDAFARLLSQLQKGKSVPLGRSKLYQLREAILKLNRTTTILEALLCLRNWRKDERNFVMEMVQYFDTYLTPQERKQRGTLFPWYLECAKKTNEPDIYRTPLLDFIDLYDFVLSVERGS